jgi:hypothetical protein
MNEPFARLGIQAVPDLRKQFIPENVLYVITGVPFPLLKKYIKIPVYEQQTVVAVIRYIHTLIKPRLIVNFPAITPANILHNSDGYA